MKSRPMSFQNKGINIYDSDSDMEEDFDEPIGKKINSKGNYATNSLTHGKNEQEGESNNETLKKNRQSAKQCRQRKKIYIELLEKNVDELRKQIETSKNNLRSELKTLVKFTSQMDPSKMHYLSSKIETQKQMSLINVEKDAKKIQNIVDLYLYKFDVNGKLRKQLVNSQFQALLKNILDHKILNFWDPVTPEIFEGNCFDIFTLDMVSSAPNLLHGNIHNNRSTMLHLLMQIRDVKHNLQAQGNRIQYLVQRLSKHLSGQGILKFMLHPLYLSESNRLDLSISLVDSFTSISTKKAKRQ